MGRSGGSWSRRVLTFALTMTGVGLAVPTVAAASEPCTVTIATVCADPGPAQEPAPTTTTTTAPEPTPAQAAAQLLDLANRDRAAAGVAPLVARGDVAEIAQGWSESMSRDGALSHNDAYFNAEARDRLGAALRGENVAYAGDIEQAHRALMNSAPHRANLLDARFTVAGMGAIFVDGTWWLTQDFLQPRAAAPVPESRTPAVATEVQERSRGAEADADQDREHDVAVLAATPPVRHSIERPSGHPHRRAPSSPFDAQPSSVLPAALLAAALAVALALSLVAVA